MQSATAQEPLVSRLVRDDPEMADIVSDFVSLLPKRIELLRQAWQRQAWDELCTLAHQLKGAGGSYGYPAISALGATMEQGFKAQQTDRIEDWLSELRALAQAARAGLTLR